MGLVTRLEVSQLIKQFEEKVVPKESLASLGSGGVLLQGIEAVKRELAGTTGSPGVKLRNLVRVLKHYVEAPKDPMNIFYANHVIAQVINGVDPTKAIKRARTECDPAKAQEEAKRAMKRIVERERQASAVAA